MSEALEKLRSIGAQKIYEQTHIPVEHVQAVLHESYDGLHKVQYLGFISILEREYKCDLQSVKLKAVGYFDNEGALSVEKSIFIDTQPKRNYKILYLILAVILFLIFLFIFYNNSKTTVTPVTEEHKIIEQVQQKVEASQVEEPAIQELEKEDVKPEPLVEKSFTIMTNKKLWIGYIELDTNKKNQTVITKELNLDPNKDWLLTLGHGYVNFNINGKETSYTDEQGLKFLYKDGELKPISFEEFKRLNRGYVW